MSYFSFSILAFSTNFCLIKNELSGNTVCLQASGFSKTRQNWPFFGIFKKLLFTQNVHVARFARNVEWYFWGDFQTLCGKHHYFWQQHKAKASPFYKLWNLFHFFSMLQKCIHLKSFLWRHKVQCTIFSCFSPKFLTLLRVTIKHE